MSDIFSPSNAKRRAFLRRHGWTPSVAITLLTRIPHWVSPDGSDFTEVEAVERIKAQGRIRA